MVSPLTQDKNHGEGLRLMHLRLTKLMGLEAALAVVGVGDRWGPDNGDTYTGGKARLTDFSEFMSVLFVGPRVVQEALPTEIIQGGARNP